MSKFITLYRHLRKLVCKEIPSLNEAEQKSNTNTSTNATVYAYAHWPAHGHSCECILPVHNRTEQENNPRLLNAIVSQDQISCGYFLIMFWKVLVSCVLAWGVSAILTACGAFSDDANSDSFYARTDTRLEVIAETDWLILPYPGRFWLANV